MRSVLITSKTKKGESALNQHWQETKKIPLRQKLIFKSAGYKHELISEDPFTILLSINNRYADNHTFLDLVIIEIKKSMEQNGATKDDYCLEVKNE